MSSAAPALPGLALDGMREDLGPGMVLFRRAAPQGLLGALGAVLAAAPARHMITPYGKPMSAAITNCGPLGWVSCRAGYRYSALDPATGRSWPAMPDAFQALAAGLAQAAGFDAFQPDCCLVNLYAATAGMTPHRDADERDFSQPIVSVSLGASAIFRFGGTARRGPWRRIRLDDRDVLVFGGPARRCYHGIDRLLTGAGEPVPLGLAEACEPPVYRVNLTFRRAA